MVNAPASFTIVLLAGHRRAGAELDRRMTL